jgi:hypothetical protein
MHKYTPFYFLSMACALLPVLVSCERASLPLESPPDEPEYQEQSDLPAPAPEGNDQAELPVEATLSSDLLECPPAGNPLYLELDHAVTFNYEGMSLSHFLHQGYVQLEALEGGLIGTTSAGRLKYSMEGVMSAECSISGEGQMTVTVEGECQDGVVKLKIDEDWQALTGEMECVDEDGEVTVVPFDAPCAGKMANYGPDGEGETFLLTSDEGGYLVMRPFKQGQGYHTWTLYSTLIPTVPLVPK